MVNPFDAAVMDWVQQSCHNGITDKVFPAITYLGEAGWLWLALGAFLLLRRPTRLWGAALLAAVAAGALVGEVALKNLVCRPRPFVTFPEVPLLISPPGGFSFPSGHSCSSFAAAAVLCRRSGKWGVPALALAGLIAFSRVFLFVHWPTDVLAGAALGVCFGLLSAWAADRWEAKHKRTDVSS